MPGMTAAPRILVVCPREEAPEEIRAALSGRYANAQVHWVSQDSLALNRAEDLQVDVVLAYADLGAEATVSLVRRLAQSLPEVAVLVLVPWDGMALARHAVLAGARGFLMQPIDPEELNRSLTEALRAAPKAHAVPAEEAGPRREGQVIVFCAPKGGTGRTTLAVNTALSLRGVTAERAIIVDADWAAPAIDVALNLKHMHDLGDLLPRMAGLDEALVDAVLVEHSTGVKALLAPPPTRGAPLINPAQIQLLFSVLRRMAEWVVVDLGLPLDETAFSFLAEADRVVLNVLPEMIGLRNTRRVLERMLAHGVPRRRILVVVNRATLTGGMPLTDIQGRLGIDVAYQIPDDQPTVTSSVNRGVPLVVDRRYTALARAMREFAQRLVVAAEEAQDEEAEGKAFPKVEEAQRPPRWRLPRWAWAGAAALVVIAALGVLGGPRLAQAWRAQRQAAVPTAPAATPSPAAVAMADGTANPTADASVASPTAAEPTLAEPTSAPPTETSAAATPTVAPATPTVAPSPPAAPSPTVAPSPTAPPTAPASPTAAPATPTAAPASPTPAPSATPTQTPPPTAAPTAAPTVVPTRTLAPVWASGWYPSPLLVSPEPRETFAAGEPVILSWEPAGELRAGVFYMITLAYRYGGRTVYDDVPWLKETSWDVTEHEYLRDLAERGQFYWSLTLMRQTGLDAEGKPVGTAISPMSEVRMFTWGPASGG